VRPSRFVGIRLFRPAYKRPQPLSRTFFDRDPRQVGRDLLGKVLVRREKKYFLAARIVEVEAYLGGEDAAAHAFAGRTARNAVLFGPPGFAYVYFIYGNHYCLNVSCLPDGIPGGILFRALEPLAGIDRMAALRAISLPRGSYSARDLRQLATGPGRLAEAFGITRDRDNGKDLTDPDSGLFLADDGHPAPQVRITPRIGITKAADLPLRYIVADSLFVSGPRTLRGTAPSTSKKLQGNTILSMSRVLPTKAATATSAGRSTRATGSRVSGSTISK